MPVVVLHKGLSNENIPRLVATILVLVAVRRNLKSAVDAKVCFTKPL
jgi:hypothetical protein